MLKPRWVTWGVLAGFLLLCALAFLTVWRVESRVVAEALAEQGSHLERHFEALVARVALKEFSEGAGGLEAFSRRIVALASSNPAILDLVVLTPERRVVISSSGGDLPCGKVMPLGTVVNHQHAAGAFSRSPVGCLGIPVRVNGMQKASVVFHTERDWLMGGERVGRAVRSTAFKLMPVFVAFYVLLAVLLVCASRAARRWRARAASAERVH